MAEVVQTWRLLNFEQRVAGVGALLLVVSTFGPFSFVEAAEILLAAALLGLLYARAKGKRFHLPFGDGTAILAAGIWAALLIVARLLDRPLGQNMLALVCSGILAVAGAAERAKRPADDIPEAAPPEPASAEPASGSEPAPSESAPSEPPPSEPGPSEPVSESALDAEPGPPGQA